MLTVGITEPTPQEGEKIKLIISLMELMVFNNQNKTNMEILVKASGDLKMIDGKDLDEFKYAIERFCKKYEAKPLMSGFIVHYQDISEN